MGPGTSMTPGCDPAVPEPRGPESHGLEPQGPRSPDPGPRRTGSVTRTIAGAAGAIAVAARLFGSEAVLYSQNGNWRDLFRRGTIPSSQPSFGAAVLTLIWLVPLVASLVGRVFSSDGALRKLMMDTALVALKCGLTPVATLMLDGAFTPHLDEGLRASTMTVPPLSDPSVHLFRRMFAWAVTCRYATCASDHDLGGRAVAALEALAREGGMRIAEQLACIPGYCLDVDRRDTEAGAKRIDRFEAIMIPSQPL